MEQQFSKKNGHRAGKYAPQLVYPLAHLHGGLFPQDERKRKKKKEEKHLSEMVWERKVWSGGNIHRGNGISLEEVASLLYLMRWRRNRERVKESMKEAAIGRMEKVKGKMMRAEGLSQMAGTHFTHKNSFSFTLYNLTQFSRRPVKQTWVSLLHANAVLDQMGIVRYLWILIKHIKYN